MGMKLLGASVQAFSQENITLDLKKPKVFENRKLASENNTDKKIGTIKKIKENIVSHYNFHFNANNKLNDVLSNAKFSFKDNFEKLIPVHDYSIEQTAAMQSELDSVIIKCNNGILLHDLRNDWVDDLYFLMGKAYFYEKKFDSAYDVFQYINYNFQPRDKDEIGFEKTIGSNINNSGNIYTIASIEKKGLARSSNHEKRRNDALVWIAYVLMTMDNDDEAKIMLDLLSKDINFPQRLVPLLAEKKGEWFLKKEIYDSAAYYLEKSLPICQNNKEKSRRYFLIAQLYSLINNVEKAYSFFEKSIANTTDPLMEANARIQQITAAVSENEAKRKIDQNIQALLSLIEKEKYASFRPLIYTSIATLELKRDNANDAINYLKKSTEFSQDDPALKNRNFLKIATIAYELKKYSIAKNYLDSLDESGLNERSDILTKKNIIGEIVTNLDIIHLEDSIQNLAKLPENERLTILSSILKKIKKESISEKSEKNINQPSIPKNNLLEQTSGVLFPTESTKGEWYFNNPSLVTQGKTEFKLKWGERPNVDNWRRISSINTLNKKNPLSNELKVEQDQEGIIQDSILVTMEGLLASIPVTSEQIESSNQKKFIAFINLAKIYKDKLDDCRESIFWNERLVKEDQKIPLSEEVYFDLAYCYKQEGNTEKSSYYQELLGRNFPESKLNLFLKDPQALEKIQKQKEIESTKVYEKIYDFFISGKFEEAIKMKKTADSLYQQTKWSSQLLYIESLYYINKKKDTLALETLEKIITLYPNSAMSEKAQLVSSVLKRRNEIEKELSEKSVVKIEETPVDWIDDSPLSRTKINQIKLDSMAKDKPTVQLTQPIKIDSSTISIAKKITTSNRYQFDLNDKQAILLVLSDVDIIYANEARRAIANYNNRNFADKNLIIEQEKIDGKSIIKISEFKNIVEAIDYMDQAKKLGPSEIFPWLPKEKYSFLMISPSNFKILLEENKISPYLEFIKIQLPGKF